MELLFKGLLALHLGALVVGGATNLVMPVFAGMLGGGGVAEAGAAMRRFALAGKIALLVLLVTGVSMLALRYGGDPVALGPAFLGKLALVALLILFVGFQYLPPERRPNPAILGAGSRLSLIGILLLSVWVFG